MILGCLCLANVLIGIPDMMLRPLAIDILNGIYPVVLGIIALVAGRCSIRWPRTARYCLVGLALAGVAIVSASMGQLLPDFIDEFIWLIGGEVVINCWMALILIG